MKPNIHPNWYPDAVVKCACGAKFTVGSTQPEIHLEVCSVCHPFYTGESKFIDTMGRVERFQQRQSVRKMAKKVEEPKDSEENLPRKTLKEILSELKNQQQ